MDNIENFILFIQQSISKLNAAGYDNSKIRIYIPSAFIDIMLKEINLPPLKEVSNPHMFGVKILESFHYSIIVSDIDAPLENRQPFIFHFLN